MLEIKEVKVVKRWAVAEMKEIEMVMGEVNVKGNHNVDIYEDIPNIVSEEPKILFPVYQAFVGEEVVTVGGYDFFLPRNNEEAADEYVQNLIDDMTYTEAEMWDLLETLGYDIRFEDGEVDGLVVAEMAINEGFEFNELLNRWFNK